MRREMAIEGVCKTKIVDTILQRGIESKQIPPKAAATRCVVIYQNSSYEGHRTKTASRGPCTRRHTLLVTRAGANE